MFTLQRCFKNMHTSLEQVNEPSYEMVTKIQQQTRLIRLNLTETHDQMFFYQSEFVTSGVCNFFLNLFTLSLTLARAHHVDWSR